MFSRLRDMLFPRPPVVQALTIEMQAIFEIESLNPRSPRWRTVRAQWLVKNPRCAVCDTINDVEVHHCKPYHLFPSLELEPDNLMTLCASRGHHILFGHCLDFRAWNPDVRKDVAAARRMIMTRKYTRDD